MLTDNPAPAADASAPPGPCDRHGLPIDVIAMRYGLADNFFLGAALYHMIRAPRSPDAAGEIRSALYFVESEIERVGDEPCCDEEAIGWAPPGVIAKAYGATGNLEAAIVLLLEICAYAVEDDEDEETGEVSTPLEVLSDMLRLALDDLSTKPEIAA